MGGEYTLHVEDDTGIGTTITFTADTPNEAVVTAHESIEALNNCNESITSGDLSTTGGEPLGTVELTPET